MTINHWIKPKSNENVIDQRGGLSLKMDTLLLLLIATFAH